MNSIYDLSLSKLTDVIIDLGYKKFAAMQIYDWLYKKRVKSFDEMTNIKKELVDYLKNNYVIESINIINKQEDKDVSKYLFNLSDNQKVEAVYMHHNYGHSLCISTQVGCNMGCAFCESGRLKKLEI